MLHANRESGSKAIELGVNGGVVPKPKGKPGRPFTRKNITRFTCSRLLIVHATGPTDEYVGHLQVVVIKHHHVVNRRWGRVNPEK